MENQHRIIWVAKLSLNSIEGMWPPLLLIMLQAHLGNFYYTPSHAFSIPCPVPQPSGPCPIHAQGKGKQKTISPDLRHCSLMIYAHGQPYPFPLTSPFLFKISIHHQLVLPHKI